MSAVINLFEALPRELWLQVIFKELPIKNIMSLKYLSKHLKQLVEEYQTICNTHAHINYKYINCISKILPNIEAEVRCSKYETDKYNCTQLPEFYPIIKHLRIYHIELEGKLDLTLFENLVSLRLYCNYRHRNSRLVFLLGRMSNMRTLSLCDINVEINLALITSLQYLFLDNVINISDISQLTKLVHLSIVRSVNNSDLSKLTNLETLVLRSSNNSSNISGLYKLKDLTIVSCANNSDLSKLTNLRTLVLCNGEYTSDLSKLTKLYSLTLSGVKNTSDITKLTKLTSLKINRSDTRYDLRPLTHLRHLSLFNCCSDNIVPSHYIKHKYIHCSNH